LHGALCSFLEKLHGRPCKFVDFEVRGSRAKGREMDEGRKTRKNGFKIENLGNFEEYFYDENGNLTDTIDFLDSVNIERNKKIKNPF